MKRGICGGIMAVLFAVLVGILLAPWRWDGAGGMHLLGEELIDGGGSARRFAHAMHSEATAIWADRRSWHQATRQSDAHESMQVESIRIDHGPFNASGVLLTRGVATIANVSARARLAVAVSQWPHEYPPEFDPYEGPRLSPRGIHGETVTQSAQSLSHSTLVLMSSVLVCCASFRSYANAHNAQVIFVWALPL